MHWRDNVKYLKGVGPRVSNILAKLDINIIEDLVCHFPNRIEDRSNFSKICDLQENTTTSVKGTVIECQNRKAKSNSRFIITTALISDETGYMNLVWFNQGYKKDEFEKLKNKNIIVYGTVNFDGWKYSVNNPEYELDIPGEEEHSRMIPVYPLTEGISQNLMRKIVANAVREMAGTVKEDLPDYILKNYDLIGKSDAILNIHFPQSMDAYEQARRRLAFDELFLLQLTLLVRKKEMSMPGKGIKFNIPVNYISEYNSLFPFDLTPAQKKVISEILGDMIKPDCMNRLLQGDVGSGKTVVALCAMLLAVRCGYQSAIMAPTEILAEQHYITLSRMLSNLNVMDAPISLLKGSLTAKQKREVYDKIANGESKIIVGTHALISEKLEFNHLGLVVIDEQHRFGVRQRARLFEKGDTPDILLMTATPIPRTLTMAVYGDLNVSTIDQLPPGRKPITTHWKQLSERESVYKSLKRLIADGRQAYVVCPLIEESEKLQVQAASELFEYLNTKIYPDLTLALLHGQMKTDEKDAIMQDFRDHKIDILVSTSVIEVGVDVPNANCIVIENADRFGLSQLHQLRGRVGRGQAKSFCVLVSDPKTEEARKRLEVMKATNNGFEISEEDLKIRGPGELTGTRQSGLADFKVADIFKDVYLLELAKKTAAELLESDPNLYTVPGLKDSVLKKLEEIETTAKL